MVALRNTKKCLPPILPNCMKLYRFSELILPKLVSMNVITIDEMGEIMIEETSEETVRVQVGVLLYGHIWKGICAGCAEVFTKLLHVIRSVDNHRCEQISL